jgi:hypothetical protein
MKYGTAPSRPRHEATFFEFRFGSATDLAHMLGTTHDS